MSYRPHSSTRLKELFEAKRYQGNDPRKARFLFVGRDANYDENIEKTLPEIFDYHVDGVRWWIDNEVHHPFMLGQYPGKGKRYHENFAKIGFTPYDAESVSFVELFHLPTTGRSEDNEISLNDLCPDHLDWLVEIFDHGSARHIFLQGGQVTELMRRTEKFSSWLCRVPLKPWKGDGDLWVLPRRSDQTVYEMYHMSCWRPRQASVLERQIAQIRKIRRIFLENQQHKDKCLADTEVLTGSP